MHDDKMGTKPVLPLLISMAVPAMFSMLILALYNVVDSVFVSKLGTAGLTAVSVAFPIQMLMTAVGVGTGVGVNSLIARRLGEKRNEEASSVALHGLLLALIGWGVFALFGIFGTNIFVDIYTNSAEVATYAKQYISIVVIFSLGSMIQMMIEKVLQSTGAMVYAMIIQLIGAVTNIILDPIMIFGLLGFPKMGVAGAAIATVTGQILGGVVGLIILFTKVKVLHISFKGFKWNGRILKDIYEVGLPAIFMQAIGSVMVMGLNLILAKFSDTAVAVLGVYYKLQSFVFMPVFGLNQGLMPIMGYNFGARNKQRIYEALRYGIMFAFIIMCVGCIIFNMIPETLLGIFNPDEEMLIIGLPALRYISLSFPLASISIIISTVFQAIGKGKFSLLISLLRQLILILPIAYIMSLSSLNGVWLAFPVAEVIAFFISIGIYRMVKNTIIEKLVHDTITNTDAFE